mmetsp:Transcript_5411/g.12487  ORF Transcript_5411/g.12487 Transcript_5411/m.12487 type:complete len:329 (+) Transcript_5411:642-1628(+)
MGRVRRKTKEMQTVKKKPHESLTQGRPGIRPTMETRSSLTNCIIRIKYHLSALYSSNKNPMLRSICFSSSPLSLSTRLPSQRRMGAGSHPSRVRSDASATIASRCSSRSISISFEASLRRWCRPLPRQSYDASARICSCVRSPCCSLPHSSDWSRLRATESSGRGTEVEMPILAHMAESSFASCSLPSYSLAASAAALDDITVSTASLPLQSCAIKTSSELSDKEHSDMLMPGARCCEYSLSRSMCCAAAVLQSGRSERSLAASLELAPEASSRNRRTISDRTARWRFSFTRSATLYALHTSHSPKGMHTAHKRAKKIPDQKMGPPET